MSAEELERLLPLLRALRDLGAQHVELRATGDVAVVFQGASAPLVTAFAETARDPSADVEAGDRDALFDSADE